jgi:hypothetical protein
MNGNKGLGMNGVEGLGANGIERSWTNGVGDGAEGVVEACSFFTFEMCHFTASLVC